MDKLFRIGEMAKLFHMSMSTLRHYENIGLLKPEMVDQKNGYRYYSVRQFEALNTVRYLRALDMPLSEIEDFLQNREVDAIEAKLRQQKEEVAARRRELERIERKIDNRLRQLQEASSAERIGSWFGRCPPAGWCGCRKICGSIVRWIWKRPFAGWRENRTKRPFFWARWA